MLDIFKKWLDDLLDQKLELDRANEAGYDCSDYRDDFVAVAYDVAEEYQSWKENYPDEF